MFILWNYSPYYMRLARWVTSKYLNILLNRNLIEVLLPCPYTITHQQVGHTIPHMNNNLTRQSPVERVSPYIRAPLIYKETKETT